MDNLTFDAIHIPHVDLVVLVVSKDNIVVWVLLDLSHYVYLLHSEINKTLLSKTLT